MNRTDIVNNIITARNDAHDKARAYRNYKPNTHKYWRTLAAAETYDETLTMFAQGTQNKIPNMAADAIEIYEYTLNNDKALSTSGGLATIAVAEGHKNALATVTEWMNT